MKPCFFSFLSREPVTLEVPGHGRVTLRGLGLAGGIGLFSESRDRINTDVKVWAVETAAALKPMLGECAAERLGAGFGVDRIMLSTAKSWWGEHCVGPDSLERAATWVRLYDYRSLSGSEVEAFLVMAAYVCSKCRDDWEFLRESLLRKPTQRVFLHEAMVWFSTSRYPRTTDSAVRGAGVVPAEGRASGRIAHEGQAIAC